MPRSLKVARYPQHLFDLLNIRLPHFIILDTEKQAQKLRFQIWGFRDALANENHPGAAKIDAMLLRVDGPRLIIEARDNADANIAAQIRAALPQSAPTEVETPSAPKPQSHMEDFLTRYMRGDKRRE